MMTTIQTEIPQMSAPAQINTVKDLLLEEAQVRARIRQQEKELKGLVGKLPGELVFSGLKAVVPGFIAGKVTDTALSGLRAGVHMLFAKNEGKEGDKTQEEDVEKHPVLGMAKNIIRRVGVATALRFAYNAFIRKKIKL